MTPRCAVLTAAVALLAAALPASAPARTATCPAKAGTVFHDADGRAWHTRGRLYSCTVGSGHEHVVQLGPWKRGSRLAWEPTHAVWSVPGSRGDRLWAASTEDGKRWLLGAPALGDAEAHVQRLLVNHTAAAWVTRGGTVVLALQEPQRAPEAVGALPQGPPQAHGHLTIVGTWKRVSPSALGRSMKLALEQEECGGTDDFLVTVAPDPADPDARIGVAWVGAWDRPFCR